MKSGVGENEKNLHFTGMKILLSISNYNNKIPLYPFLLNFISETL